MLFENDTTTDNLYIYFKCCSLIMWNKEIYSDIWGLLVRYNLGKFMYDYYISREKNLSNFKYLFYTIILYFNGVTHYTRIKERIIVEGFIVY